MAYDRKAALALAKGVDRIIATKGKQIITLKKTDKPNDDDLSAVLLGPTGNLRAPTLRKGKTLVVGFHPDIYRMICK